MGFLRTMATMLGLASAVPLIPGQPQQFKQKRYHNNGAAWDRHKRIQLAKRRAKNKVARESRRINRQ